MAFKSKDLSVLSYANGFTLWHYVSADLPADIDTEGYFNAAADMMRVGDFVVVHSTPGPSAGLMFVRASAGGVVDVADLTAVGAVNTD